MCKGQLLFFLVTTSLLQGCSNNEATKSVQAPDEKGWFCYQAPNDLDQPGQIFRVDENGVKFREANFSKNIEINVGTIVDSSFTQNRIVSANILGNLLAIPTEKKPKIFADLDARRNVKIEIGDRLIHTTDLQDMQYIKSQFLKILEGGGFEENSEYFVIRETIAAKNINIQFDRKFLAGVEAEAEVKKAFSGKATVGGNAGGQYSVNQKLDNHATVCLKPMKFDIKVDTGSGFGGVTKYNVSLQDYDNEILFSNE